MSREFTETFIMIKIEKKHLISMVYTMSALYKVKLARETGRIVRWIRRSATRQMHKVTAIDFIVSYYELRCQRVTFCETFLKIKSCLLRCRFTNVTVLVSAQTNEASPGQFTLSSRHVTHLIWARHMTFDLDVSGCIRLCHGGWSQWPSPCSLFHLPQN